MLVVPSRQELISALDLARHDGRRVALVPTMGALHDGHMSLVNAARKSGADFVALSIFINPTQFDDPSDLAEYPMTLERDLTKCEQANVDLVFVPSASEMYPDGFSTTVRAGKIALVLEGEYRTGHFDGVATVVSKLLNLASPCIAVFGQKDYQQFEVVRRVVADLDIRAELVRAPIARDERGLALSSRNARLTREQQRNAANLHRVMKDVASRVRSGELNSSSDVSEFARSALERVFDAIDYVRLVHGPTLTEINEPQPPSAEERVILAAVHLAGVRLIDNVVIDEAGPFTSDSSRAE